MKTVQQILLEKGLTENIDYAFDGVALAAITKQRFQVIHHDLVPATYDENNIELTPEIAAYDETTQVIEDYVEIIPSLDSIKMEIIEDLALAVGEYLSDKQILVDHENDSINIHNGQIVRFDFKNIAQPTPSQLYDCYVIAKTKLDAFIRVNDIKAKGAKARLACQSVLDLISGHNQTAQLTSAQITQMTTTFSPVVQALMIYRPGLAKSLIISIVPDEVIITTQLKTDVLAELVDY